MLLPHPNAREVSRWVAHLPMEYLVSRHDDHWVVVGPTGIFVVGSAGDDPFTSAEAALSLAHRIRSLLSDLVPWVPFIDAFLVGNDREVDAPCTVVDIASLEMALLSGPLSIDEHGVGVLRQHVPAVLSEIASSAEDAHVPPSSAVRLD